jgi:isocitrate dehydrogenase (NAD+)
VIVDNCCMQLVLRPGQFDVLVAGNLFGDIVSDLGAGLVGGISAMHAINFGHGLRVFETFHGGSRDEIGPDRANPLPLLLPAIDLLETAGERVAASRIFKAIGTVLTARRALTPDLGGDAGTQAMAEALCAALN